MTKEEDLEAEQVIAVMNGWKVCPGCMLAQPLKMPNGNEYKWIYLCYNCWQAVDLPTQNKIVSEVVEVGTTMSVNAFAAISRIAKESNG